MNAARIAAIALIVAGVLALIYGGFTYTKSSSAANVGPIEMTVKDKKTIDIPIWAGVGAIVAGGVLLFASRRKT